MKTVTIPKHIKSKSIILICKKDFFNHRKKLIYKKNQKYTTFNNSEIITNDTDYYNSIFVFYDEFAKDPTERGYTFYIIKDNSYNQYNNLLSDYFYTEKEIRKLKIEKLNEYK